MDHVARAVIRMMDGADWVYEHRWHLFIGGCWAGMLTGVIFGL